MPPAATKIVTIIDCRNNGEKTELPDVTLDATLGEIKTIIELKVKTAVADQRLFYMGREIKSQGKTLSSLGVGKFSYYVHLFSTKAPMTAQAGSKKREAKIKAAKKPVAKKRKLPVVAKGEVICLDSDEEENVEEVLDDVKPSQSKKRRGSSEDEVIVL